jgi:hypothetical protein
MNNKNIKQHEQAMKEEIERRDMKTEDMLSNTYASQPIGVVTFQSICLGINMYICICIYLYAYTYIYT